MEVVGVFGDLLALAPGFDAEDDVQDLGAMVVGDFGVALHRQVALRPLNVQVLGQATFGDVFQVGIEDVECQQAAGSKMVASAGQEGELFLGRLSMPALAESG